MLVGRFLLIIPVLAIAGSLARKQPVPATAGTFPTDTPLFVGLLVGVVAHRRRPDLLPRRSPSARSLEHLTPDESRSPRSVFDPAIARAARLVDSFRKLDPRAHGAQPGHVRRRGRRSVSRRSCSSGPRRRDHEPNVFAGLRRRLAVVHRALRQLRRGDGRRPRQGAGRHAAQDARRDDGAPPASPTGPSRSVPSAAARASATRSSSTPAR